MSTQFPSLLPIFLKATGRRCLVVGGGTAAEEKVRSTLAAGMTITVVSPDATPTIALWARENKLRWEQREFHENDLGSIFLVIVATNQRALNADIYRLACTANVLCNVVDDPENCDFYHPAVVRRGALQIAISTGGHSPALAQRLRKKLEEQFPLEYAAWVEELGAIRRELRNLPMDAGLRRCLLHHYAEESVFQRFLHELSSESLEHAE